jgi:maltooligosyltrehalose trehalohydrolase
LGCGWGSFPALYLVIEHETSDSNMQHLANLRPPLGATYVAEKTYHFHLWAPNVDNVKLRLLDPEERLVEMEAIEEGFHQARVEGLSPGTRYFYRLDNEKDRPDPTSRYQPEGVHGPSQLVDPHFEWQDHAWAGLPLQQYILYELHVGTFTPEGTFEAIIPHLEWLKELGVTAIELMPVAQFPGTRNWGYDGVNLFAVQDSYGGNEGLKKLVDACHQAGLAVVLDVVYNHLGAEGNYLWDYGPYFTDRYQTPWGSAVNFDGPGSDQVRRYFIENAVYFLRDFHIDALRLDAIHAMLDFSAVPFLEEMAAVVDREAVHLNRRVYLIAESDLNDARIVRSREAHGYGLDAQWSDDFHHAVHVLLTGETQGYYRDFIDESGAEPLQHLTKALTESYVYSGQFSVARGRRHGNPSREIPAHRFIVCIQNHDQVGNRMEGERLAALTSWPRVKLGAALLLLSPYVPLLFMGEEYGEAAPFLYFASNTDLELVEAIRQGRKREFAEFMQGEPPDPFAEETFQRSKLNHALAQEGKHAELRELYRTLIQLRKTLPPMELLSKEQLAIHAFEEEQVLLMHRWYGPDQIIALFNFNQESTTLLLPIPTGRWNKLTDSDLGKSDFPGQIDSPGKSKVHLPAERFALYESRRGIKDEG